MTGLDALKVLGIDLDEDEVEKNTRTLF